MFVFLILLWIVDSTSSAWANLTSDGNLIATIQIPSQLVLEVTPAGQREQQAFRTQPKLAMYDAVVCTDL